MKPHSPTTCRTCRSLVAIIGRFKRCWIAQRKLAADLLICERTVRSHLAALITAGILVRERYNRQTTNRYQLTIVEPEARRSREAIPAAGASSRSHSKMHKRTPDVAVLEKNCQPGSELVAALIAHRVSDSRATRLVREHPRERILRQLRWLRFRRATDTGAVLAESIAHDWGEPLEARRQREREQQLERETRAIAAAAELEARAIEAATRAAAAVALVPLDERAALRAAANTSISQSWPRFLRRDGTAFCSAVESEYARRALERYTPYPPAPTSAQPAPERRQTG